MPSIISKSLKRTPEPEVLEQSSDDLDSPTEVLAPPISTNDDDSTTTQRRRNNNDSTTKNEEPRSRFGDAIEAGKKREKENKRKTGEHLFKPGHHIGRPKGSGNKINLDLKKGLIEAAVIHGYDGKGEGGLNGYLYLLAEKQQRTFGGLLGKLLPLQLTGGVSLGIASVTVSAVPTDRYLSPDEARELAKQAIDAVAEEISDVVIEEVARREEEDEDAP